MSVALRIARRELAGGLRGFWVYALCLAVGAFAIAAAGSVTEGFDRGLQDQSRTLLGGDVEFVAAQRRASADERAVMDGLGRVSEVVNLDVMGARGDTRKQVDIRAVDGAFPLIGALSLSPAGAAAGPTLAKRDGVWGAAVSRSLLETFDADLGDAVDLGPVTVEIRAVLEATPDRVGAPGAFGPAALVALDAFIEAGRLTNGQLFRASYRVLLNEGAGGPPDAAIDAAIDAAAAAWGPAGLRARQPEDAVDGLRDALSMLNAFLAVVGVAALIAGGVGVAQATSAFLETRLEAIAALKALGADAAIIRAAYALQLSALAGVGAVGGVTLGALAPLALEAVAGARIPLDQKLGFSPGPVFLALLLAMLSAAFFAAPALGRARATKPAALFRGGLHENAAPTPRFERGAALAAGCALCAAAIATSARPPVTAGLLLGAALAYGVLRLAALGVKRAARAGARRRSGIVRIALSNLAGPQSLAPLIAPALGLGLALSTLIAGVQENLIRQLNETAPSNAPSLVFTQIPNQETAAFDAALAREGVDVSDVDAFRRAPIALARVVALNGAPIERDKIAESERWVVESEVALTYLADPPPEADITDGAWCPSPRAASASIEARSGPR
ncbi:MAG: FtsX-like permease family protein [Pseudomonadota bacterium]